MAGGVRDGKHLRRRTVIVTGCNSGVGYGLLERFLGGDDSSDLPPHTLIMACRSIPKAQAARRTLLERHPSTPHTLVPMKLDLASLSSVYSFLHAFKQDFRSLNVLFCNAGILPVKRFALWEGLKAMLRTRGQAAQTGEGFLVQERGLISEDGLGLVFQSNVFSHFVMMGELSSHLTHPDTAVSGGGRVVWTGSSTVPSNFFDFADFQCLNGPFPYQSSKYLIDRLTMAMAQVPRVLSAGSEQPKAHIRDLGLTVPQGVEREKRNPLYVYVAHPGTVESDILKSWIGRMLQRIFCFLLRPFFPFLTGTPANAAVSLFKLGTATDLGTLDPAMKYHSQVTWDGRAVVKGVPITLQEGDEGVIAELRRLKVEVVGALEGGKRLRTSSS